MRGLDIRLRWARGVVAASIFGGDEGNELLESREDAIALGHFDHQVGRDRDDPPGLIRDVCSLLQAWLSGWDDADEAKDMQQCQTCQSTSTVFCPVHG